MMASHSTSEAYRRSGLRRALDVAVLGLALTALSGCLLHHGPRGKVRAHQELAATNVTAIGVNAYLWRASLDALSFMPLVQAATVQKLEDVILTKARDLRRSAIK